MPDDENIKKTQEFHTHTEEREREREQTVGNECLLKMFLALALQVSYSYLMRKQQPYKSWL